MKETDNLYKADIENMSITATAADEEKALSRLARKVTALMTEKPDLATDLAQWFANGRPISKAKDGGLPDYIKFVDAFGAEPKVIKLKSKTPADKQGRSGGKRRPRKK